MRVELPHKAQRSSSTALLLATTIVVGVLLLSFFNVQAADELDRRNLEDRASTIAASLDANEILKLSGKPSDVNLPEYKDLKSRLLALKQINTDTRDVYLTGQRDGKLFFYVDSELPNTTYYSPPGTQYPEASTAFKNMFFSSPLPLVEGPLKDTYGTWVSGLAPIFNPHTGRVLAVVGMDIDSVTFNESLLGSLGLPLGVGLILLTVVVIYEIVRRRDAQLLRLRSELVSIASHELRSPLVGIRWALEGLLKSVSNKAEEQKLQAIYDSIIHLQAGAEDILQFTALDNKKFAPVPTDMTALVKEIADTQRLLAQQKNVKLLMDDSWPEKLTIACDASRMKRALHNVVSNAIKYTRNNTEVVLHYEHSQGEHRISVVDHGIGIPQAEQKRVFGGFYRASNAKASGVQGTGLGLYLTRAILAQHRGKITFTSEEGKGTTFTLMLPG